MYDLEEEEEEEEDEEEDEEEEEEEDSDDDDDDMHIDAKKGGLVGKSTLPSQGPPERTEPT